MKSLRCLLGFLALLLPACLVLSCGMKSPGQDPLQSITLSPASADAQDYPNGQVPFVATGYYADPTRKVTPLSAFWGTCYQASPTQEAPTNAVTVTQAGVAQCTAGAVGTYTVWANDPPYSNVECLAITACGGGCFVAGTAQLTCP